MLDMVYTLLKIIITTSVLNHLVDTKRKFV